MVNLSGGGTSPPLESYDGSDYPRFTEHFLFKQLSVFKNFQSGGTCGAVTPLAACGFNLACVVGDGFCLFRAEQLDSARRTEEFDNVIDRGDIGLNFSNQRFSRALFTI